MYNTRRIEGCTCSCRWHFDLHSGCRINYGSPTEYFIVIQHGFMLYLCSKVYWTLLSMQDSCCRQLWHHKSHCLIVMPPNPSIGHTRKINQNLSNLMRWILLDFSCWSADISNGCLCVVQHKVLWDSEKLYSPLQIWRFLIPKNSMLDSSFVVVSDLLCSIQNFIPLIDFITLWWAIIKIIILLIAFTHYLIKSCGNHGNHQQK